VKREEKFVMSHKPFAVDLATFRDGELYEHGSRFSVHARIDAVWYRRKDGETRACLGSLGLWSQCLREPVDPLDPAAVLSADLDSRYGGDCHGRWDGIGYWGAEDLDVQAQHLALLRPMLENFPQVPAGFDGWWTFRCE
jgi:hypothetical protein